MRVEFKRFRPDLHPRDTDGRFVEVLDGLLDVPSAPSVSTGNARVIRPTRSTDDIITDLVQRGLPEDVDAFVRSFPDIEIERLIASMGLPNPLTVPPREQLTQHLKALLARPKAKRKKKHAGDALVMSSALDMAERFREMRATHAVPASSNRARKWYGDPIALETKDALAPPPFDGVTTTGFAILLTEVKDGQVWQSDSDLERRIEWMEDYGLAAVTFAEDGDQKVWMTESLYRGPVSYMDLVSE